MPLGDVFFQNLGDHFMLLNDAFILELFSDDLDFKHSSTPSAGISHINLRDRQGTLQFLLYGRLYLSGKRP